MEGVEAVREMQTWPGEKDLFLCEVIAENHSLEGEEVVIDHLTKPEPYKGKIRVKIFLWKELPAKQAGKIDPENIPAHIFPDGNGGYSVIKNRWIFSHLLEPYNPAARNFLKEQKALFQAH